MRSPLMALLVTAAIATGCSSAVAPTGDISVQTAISTITIRLGQPATVTVTVTNNGEHTRQLMARSGFCPQAFLVSTPAGEVVWPSGIMCALDLQAPLPLAPGESVAFTAQLSLAGDAQSAQGQSGRLPVGTYTVRGAVPIVGGHEVRGPAVEIRVVP